MIADEMGLGKTVQAIAVVSAYRGEWPVLVVVPSSLKYPWIEELERWIPDLQPGDVNLVETKSDTTRIGSSKVTVLGYGLLTTDASTLVDALTRQRFAVVVADESHYLKSRNAARTKILVPLIQSAKRAVLLTGTPALGRPEELFMQIDALHPKRFGTWSDYAKKYCNAHFRYFGSRRQWDCRGASNLEELHRRLSQVMIRRLKADVLTQLPPKVRQRIPFDLPKETAKEATASFAEWEKLMKGPGSGVASTDSSFSEVMGLVTQMYKQTAIAKAGAVKDYIKMMLEAEQLKFLVFAHHLTMLQACTEAAVEAKAGYIRIDGSVPSSERIQLVHKFQSDPETRVAILSIQAAGQGLTFTAASHVVFAELYWNPGHMKQAEDRAHRIGQTCSVNVHYLIAKGTFDTAMWAMLNRKEKVTGSTLNGRKGYLEAGEGDKDKWEFLNFASAWTPSEMVLPADDDMAADVYFSHHEKEKQHDIRSFFSPGGAKEKKRKRTKEEEGASPSAETTVTPSRDFSPQVKKFRTPLASLDSSPRGRCGGKRRSTANPVMTPRRLSEPDPDTTWICRVCTYVNSTLLPYCEMCEAAARAEPTVTRDPAARITLPPDVEGLGLEKAKQSAGEEEEEGEDEEGHPPKDKQKLEGAKDEDKLQLEGKQSAGGSGGDGGDTHPPTDGAQDRQAADANDDDEGGGEEDHGAAYPLHPGLLFCASQYTDRIYLYSKDRTPLNLSFVPLDIKLTNWDDLPKAFCRRREHRLQVLRFVQEWSGLPAMKQKLLRRSGVLFHTPTLGLQQLAAAQRPHSSTKRYLSRDDVARASLSRAQQEGGTVRVVTKETKKSASSVGEDQLPVGTEETPGPPGFLQALDGQGVPLCLSCQQACRTSGGAWDTRFCSHRCQEEFLLRSSQTFMRSRVLEAERGVCQHCGLNAHDLFVRVRDAPPPQRKGVLENTWLAQLPLKQLNEMIRAPVEGDFWQVDHIRPVYSGGGQCSLDNLQTLCTVCHRARTARQAKERSQTRRSAEASAGASDIRKFFVRK